MRRIAKKITLKEDTMNDIELGNIDTDLFINRINEYLSRANHLINTKMDNMEDMELLENLEVIFDIYFDEKDYLRMLTLKYGNHYLYFKHIRTNMYDENDNNVSYLGAVTSKVKCPDGSVLDFKKLGKLTNSGDILLVKQFVSSAVYPIGKREKYRELFVDEVDLESGQVDKTSNLYPYAATVVRKETIIKYVLYDLKKYINEVTYQAKKIIDLHKNKDEEIASIGKQYKSSYDNALNNGSLFRGEKVSVRYHQKIKKKKKNNEIR